MHSDGLGNNKAVSTSFLHRSFLTSVGFSLISKVASVGVQFLAIPVAIASCGMATYVLYVQMVALTLGPCVFLIRLGPRFVGIIAVHFSNRDYSQLVAVARKGWLLTALASLLVCCAIAITPFVPSFKTYFSQQGVLEGFAILSFATLFGGILQSVEAVQLGMHESHFISACYAISNILCGVLLITAVPVFANLLSLILVLHVTPLLARTILAILFFARHRKHFLCNLLQIHQSQPIVLDAVSYTFIAGFCSYLGFQAPMLSLTSSAPLGESQTLALAFQFTLQGLGLMGVVFVPIVPIFADCLNSGNLKQLRRYQVNILLTVLGATFVGTACGIGCGLLARENLNVTEGQLIAIVVSAGFFLGALGLEQFLSTFLLATSSTNESFRVYSLTFLRSLLTFGVAMIAIHLGLHLSAMLLMAIVVLLSTCLPLQLTIAGRQRVKSV
jgi:hypothetical protein